MQSAFKALGDLNRVRIVQYLAGFSKESENFPTASDVCRHLTGAEKINSTVSHHLHELENSGLIRIERSGKKMICSLRPEALKFLASELVDLAEGRN